MAGELYRDVVQIGKEITFGVDAVATRKVYGQSIDFQDGREGRVYEFATGGREQARAMTLGPENPDGQIVIPMSADELLEWWDVGIAGGVTPSTPDAANAPTARLWVHKPSNVVGSLTMERDDGAVQRNALGVRVNEYTLEGSAGGDNLLTMALMGTTYPNAALTGALTDRVPTFMEGWQTNFYLDAFGGTPGTTLISDVLINWRVQIANNAQRKRAARNAQSASGVNLGKFAVTATLTLEAAATQVGTELTNRSNVTGRLARLEFMGPAGELGTGLYSRRFVTIDLPGRWGAVNLEGEDGGTRVYEFTMHALYDPTNAYSLQIRSNNTRTAMY